MDNKGFPPISSALIEALEKSFRDTVPTNQATPLEDFRLLQGQLSVVAFLRREFNKQNK